MNTRTSIFLVCILMSAWCNAALYKHVDEQGNITYTDVPPTEGADEVELEPVNVMDPVESLAPKPPSPKAATTQGYTSLEITQPTAEATLRSAPGSIQVNLRLEPKLQPGHQVRITLDGKEVSKGISTSVTLEGVDRGSHSLSASVQNSAGKTLIQSNNVQFQLHRTSVQNQKAPASAPPNRSPNS